VLEILRFCVVIFLAGIGYQVARLFDGGVVVMGPFDAQGVGMLLGAATGYVLGGVVGRLTFRTVVATESVLAGRSAEQLLAGLIGATVGVLAAAALSWPILLLGTMQFTAPIFIFVIVSVGSLGYRLGLGRRDGVLGILGERGSLHQVRVAAVALPRIIDTSVAIDARIVDVVRAGFLHGTLLVPEPVLGELQGLADAADDQRRAKGRRGLDALDSLRQERGIELEVIPDGAPEVPEVDAKLVQMCLAHEAALLTLDTNLARVASVAGCRVLNLHALALALRPPVQAGDAVNVLLTRQGKEAGQAVGYLDDGTMLVVERARDRLGQEVAVVVTSVLVTHNGRLVFARLASCDAPRPSPVGSIPRPSAVAARTAATGGQTADARTAPGVAD
jgi:uncharacterized protein YacL